jgi:HSP20 family protein
MFELIPFKLKPVNESFWPSLFTEDLFSMDRSTFKADISETDKEYVVEAELPGFVKDDISVEFRDDSLIIATKQHEVTEEKKDNYIRKERRAGQVIRAFAFDNVDGEAIKAEYKDGILKLNLPKREIKAPETRKIEIN